MDNKKYTLNYTENLLSPALIYYKDIILQNTKRTIEMAGGPEYLWPHVKSHKSAEMVRMQIELGITRFKCATVAEVEMAAEAGAKHIILAYPLIGPNVSRFLELAHAWPGTVFYAIGDDFPMLSILSDESGRMGMRMNLLVDVDIGMHRTGVPLDELESFYIKVSALKNLNLKGLHCYDGHCKSPDFNSRKAMTEEIDARF
ncbi:MAG: alanine racemase [Treponema sp.]|nr:alanine racemase [Treponema sp.]